MTETTALRNRFDPLRAALLFGAVRVFAETFPLVGLEDPQARFARLGQFLDSGASVVDSLDIYHGLSLTRQSASAIGERMAGILLDKKLKRERHEFAVEFVETVFSSIGGARSLKRLLEHSFDVVSAVEGDGAPDVSRRTFPPLPMLRRSLASIEPKKIEDGPKRAKTKKKSAKKKSAKKAAKRKKK